MDELELDLDQIEQDAEKTLEVKNRYKQLSEKLIQANKEKEELAAREAERAKALETATRERDFFKGFSAHSAKYPAVAEYQDSIWEKVSAGYSTEDAILSTLAKEGRLAGQVSDHSMDIAGGSAVNSIGDVNDKKIDDMKPEEKLAQLMELERKGELYG